MYDASDRRIVDLAIRLMFIGLFVFAVVSMVAPMAGVLIWAAILSVTLYPLWDKLRGWLGGRDVLSAVLLTLLGLVITLGPVAISLTGLINAGLDLTNKIRDGEKVVPPVPDWLSGLPVVGDQIGDIWTLFETNAHDAFQQYGEQILAVVQSIFGQVANLGLGLVFLASAVLVSGFLFIPGARIVSGAQAVSNRVFAPRGGEFIMLAGATIRNVSRGVIGVAAVQAFAAGVVMGLFGVPAAGPLALVCLILAIIQVGPSLVLIPVVIWAWMDMSTLQAILFTGLIIPITAVDNVLRPIWMAKGLDTPMLVILTGVFGGMLAYGLVGIFIGPVILAVFYELFLEWMRAQVEGTYENNDAVEAGDGS